MANQEQLKVLKQGVDVWNKWCLENETALIDLQRASLRGADLGGVHLFRADLQEADLMGANLQKADLVGARLIKANLSDAYLIEASLGVTDLSGADLRGADLRGAEISNAIFGNTDLSKTIGLKDAKHLSPSTIGTDTIHQSKSRIPEAFMRGCGLSDLDIEYSKLYNPDLSNEEINKIVYKIYDLRATQALQISPLFISYSHEDKTFVDKVDTVLTKKGVRFWRDIHDMKSGRMEKQIDRAMRLNPTVLLILSEHSLKSDWVEHEVRAARGLEK